MLTAYILIVLVGYAAGRVHARAIRWALLPPATPRAIARAARRGRLDLSCVRPAHEQGVRVVETRPLVFRDHPPRLERLSEPPSFISPIGDFDEGHTRG